MTGGYCGFYKDNFIRSSYEYVYCIILEKLELKYTVEEISYTLPNGLKYIPDFHIYKNNDLIKIVEIKSSKPSEILKAENKIEQLKELVSVPIELIKFNDLKRLCIELSLDINLLIKMWKENSVGMNLNTGNLNPMFNKNHSTKTKQLIGEKASKRAESAKYRDRIKKSVLEYYNNGGKAVGPPKKRKIVLCKECGNEFEVIQSSNRQYCSKKCSLVSTTLIANEIVRKRNEDNHKIMKYDLFEHFRLNIGLLETKRRNIIYKEVKIILKKHNITDIRIFKFMFTGSYNCSFEIVYEAFKTELNNYLKYMPNLYDGKV